MRPARFHRYRQTVTRVEAVQWDGPPEGASTDDIVGWIRSCGLRAHAIDDLGEPGICIHVKSPTVVAHPGDWIIHQAGIGFQVWDPIVFDTLYEEDGDADH